MKNNSPKKKKNPGRPKKHKEGVYTITVSMPKWLYQHMCDHLAVDGKVPWGKRSEYIVNLIMYDLGTKGKA